MIQISTPRLRLTPVQHKDLQVIHDLLSLPETDQYNALGIPKYQKNTAKHINGWISDMKASPITNHSLAIRLKTDDALIGLFGIKVASKKYNKAEIWYKLHKDHWKNGYATEAAKSAIDYCFLKLDLHRIEAGAATENKASLRVFDKIGMTLEGIKRKNLPLKTGFADNAEYAILVEEYLTSGLG